MGFVVASEWAEPCLTGRKRGGAWEQEVYVKRLGSNESDNGQSFAKGPTCEVL